MTRRYRLDQEEQELLKSIEKGKWRPVKHMEAQMEKYVEYAKNTLKKDHS